MGAHNPEELVALVDESDKVVGKCPRKALSEGRLHREASVLIVNPKGEILVQERADDGRLDYSASGHFACGESYLDGATREVLEELGLRIKKSKFVEISKHRITSKHGKKINDRFVTLFEVKVDYGTESIRIDPSEVSSVRYYPASELRGIMENEPGKMAKGFAESLKIYFEKKGL